jgi:predicted small integral membrane protein
MILRIIKLSMVGTIGLFFSLVAFNNLIEFTSNLPALQHVLSMDTTFRVPILMQRAITNPSSQLAAYYFIIACELLISTICWAGCIYLLLHIKANNQQFTRAKNFAFIGLFLGFMLYVFGFIIIASEWFCMWQSKEWNAQTTAGLFASLILFVMIFLGLPEPEERSI